MHKTILQKMCEQFIKNKSPFSSSGALKRNACVPLKDILRIIYSNSSSMPKDLAFNCDKILSYVDKITNTKSQNS